MSLASHAGKDTFTINGKTVLKRSGTSNIYDITGGGGSGGGGSWTVLQGETQMHLGGTTSNVQWGLDLFNLPQGKFAEIDIVATAFGMTAGQGTSMFHQKYTAYHIPEDAVFGGNYYGSGGEPAMQIRRIDPLLRDSSGNIRTGSATGLQNNTTLLRHEASYSNQTWATPGDLRVGAEGYPSGYYQATMNYFICYRIT